MLGLGCAARGVRVENKFASRTVVCKAASEDAKARVAKALEYKQQQNTAVEVPAPPSSSDDAKARLAKALQYKQQKAEQGSASDEDLSQLLNSAPKRQGTGSATEAADALKGVLSKASPLTEGLDPNLPAEVFTRMKEERMRARGADIITADQAYRPASEASQYQPKVSTWGVFERPKDISATFGGGRTLRPGQPTETDEQRAVREAQFQAALRKYRVMIGAEEDEQAESEAQVLYDKGMTLFNAGFLQQSAEYFTQAKDKVATRTKVGGLATLQLAITLDSLGRNSEAEGLYRSLVTHSVGTVAKKAKQMIGSFEAMKFLNADQINMGVKNKDYDRYFRRFADRNKVYVISEEERLRDEQQAKVTAFVAVAVLLGPIAAFVGAYLQSHPL